MKPGIHNPALRYYQSTLLEGDEILKDFIIRKNEFESIRQVINKHKPGDSMQHFLILGGRGSGKSTLLKRIEYELTHDKKLIKQYLVVNLPEEQSSIYRLFDLWDAVIQELEVQNLMKSSTVGSLPEDNTQYARERFDLIQEALKKDKRELVILLDNVDRILENIKDDANLLREQLTNFKNIQVIGGSTRMSEYFWKYDQPFYEFFRVIRLGACSSEEIQALLNHWSESLNLPEIKEFMNNNPGQMEAIRILTDGLPRTLLFFVDLLVNRPKQNGYFYLKHIIDLYSPQYQERLNNLPPAQRLIVTKLAEFWEAATARELQDACKMPSKTVSAQLNQLKEIGVVEVVDPNAKTFLYRISERFFNLWLIMTQGGPAQKRNAKCWTIFLENWYDELQLKKMADEYVGKMGNQELTGDHAALMAKALAHSKCISADQRDMLINSALNLADLTEDAKKMLPKLTKEAVIEAWGCFKKGEFIETIKALDSIEQNFDAKIAVKASAYAKLGEWQNILKLGATYPIESFTNDVPRSSFLIMILIACAQVSKFAEGITIANEALENNLISEGSLGNFKFLIAFCYYNLPNEQNKKHALDFMLSDNPKGGFKPYYDLIRIWNGIIVSYVELKESFPYLSPDIHKIKFLKHLLIHFQYGQVLKLYEDEELRLKGTEADAVYYAALKLQNTDELTIQRIPPEFEETVNQVVQDIRIDQKLYYPELFKGK